MSQSPQRNESTDPSARPAPERLWRQVVGEELRAIRLDRDESLRTVAMRARVSPQYLSEIERGFKEPSSEILAAIGASLDTSLLDLTTAVADRLAASSGPSRASAARVSAAAFALAA
ncbi:MAG: XRE family transcriptional regulator [Herbiconiux sp.]|uniref:helix-turn-helix domain-containing protein n=1 Tax=Herbiconiux sp. TaxID=1871186 RepID=UPI001226E212|nr:helix-turn-helix transcriptional regulator [Herbiconiux sp.]TAJ46644.1 MAG: XRE family transcriptional regulator [Herbiconiux sp.]